MSKRSNKGKARVAKYKMKQAAAKAKAAGVVNKTTRVYKKHYGNLTVIGSRKNYKNDREYVEAIYEQNKLKMQEKSISKANFVESILDDVEYGETLTKAINNMARSRALMTREEIGIENIKNDISNKELVSFKQEMHITEAWNWDKLKWDNNNQAYRYNNSAYGIRFLNPDDSKTQAWYEIVKI